MPVVQANGILIAYESFGEGFPLVLAHEFAGSMESWLPQVNFFSRRYRVIVYNARGYTPSEVPEDEAAYSQDLAVEDLRGLIEALGIDQAYVGGLSMGGSTALHFGLRYPNLAKALIIAGAGTGSTDTERFRQQTMALADRIERDGVETALQDYAAAGTRVQLRRKDPAGWEEFRRLLLGVPGSGPTIEAGWQPFIQPVAGHDMIGSANTLRGVQGKRPPIFDWEQDLRRLYVPTLILVGDEDEPCLEPSIFLKRCISRSGLVVFPRSGHTINLEEPALFNQAVLDFLHAVEQDKWGPREQGSGAGFLESSGL